MKGNVFVLLAAVALTACTGGNSSNEAGTDTIASGLMDDEVTIEKEKTLSGVVADEMMSTITIATEDSDTISYVKGETFESDAAIGDEVDVELEEQDGEMTVIKVTKK